MVAAGGLRVPAELPSAADRKMDPPDGPPGLHAHVKTTGRASEVAVRSQTAIFSRLVKDFMRRVPLAVTAGTSCADVIAGMADRMASSATVTDPEGRPLGIITERDLAHRVAFRVPPETPVEKVMTTPVMTIAANEYLYYAIARMRRRGLRHMPVVDGGGALTGMLNLHDALSTFRRAVASSAAIASTAPDSSPRTWAWVKSISWSGLAWVAVCMPRARLSSGATRARSRKAQAMARIATIATATPPP